MTLENQMSSPELSRTDRRVLAYLEAARGRVCTKAQLIEGARVLEGSRGSTRSLDSACERIKAAGYPIVNVWGVGYKLEVPAPADRVLEVSSSTETRRGSDLTLHVFDSSGDGERAAIELRAGAQVLARGEDFRVAQVGRWTWLDMPAREVVSTFGAFMLHALESNEPDARAGWPILEDAAGDVARELDAYAPMFTEPEAPQAIGDTYDPQRWEGLDVADFDLFVDVHTGELADIDDSTTSPDGLVIRKEDDR